MQSHLTKKGKDGAIYEKVPEELSLRGFVWIKKQVVSNIKNMLAFWHLEIVHHVCSLHSDVVYSFLHASGIKNK